jgi:hypothetical protein
LRARAWWGERLVAETVGAVRVDRAGQAPVLYFPREDVRFDLLDPGEGLWSSGDDPERTAFDHDRVRVELVDGLEDTAPRDVTVKRFPTWGDAADLVELLDVRPAEDSDGGDGGPQESTGATSARSAATGGGRWSTAARCWPRRSSPRAAMPPAAGRCPRTWCSCGPPTPRCRSTSTSTS